MLNTTTKGERTWFFRKET